MSESHEMLEFKVLSVEIDGSQEGQLMKKIHIKVDRLLFTVCLPLSVCPHTEMTDVQNAVHQALSGIVDPRLTNLLLHKDSKKYVNRIC